MAKREITIDINYKWCKQCSICIDFCPEDVYEDNDGYPVIKHLEKCTGCLICEKMCPDFAIQVNIKKVNTK